MKTIVGLTASPSDENRIPIIKAIRIATGLGLKEAKDLADVLRDKGFVEIEAVDANAVVELRTSGLFEDVDANDPLDSMLVMLHKMVDRVDVAGIEAALPLLRHLTKEKAP